MNHQFTRSPIRRSVRGLIVSTLCLVAFGWAALPTRVSASTPTTTTSTSPGAERIGDALVVDPSDTKKPLTHGNQKTLFTFHLDEAMCPGDSAHDQWRTNAFMVPVTEAPGDIRYGPIGPEPSGNGRYGVYTLNTHAYMFQLLMRNESAGHPGVIPTMPVFSFDVVSQLHPPSGEYRIGISCVIFDHTATYWDSVVDVTAGAPGTLSWTVKGAPASGDTGTGSGGSGLSWLLYVVIAAAVAGAAWLLRRRMSRRNGSSLNSNTLLREPR